MADIPSKYDPSGIEDKWYASWMNQGFFHSVPDHREPFCIVIPPPNVTGHLHMGHMLEHTEIDIIIRWKRMSGIPTMWLPGTDHAGIATQLMVERQLASEGKSRRDMTR